MPHQPCRARAGHVCQTPSGTFSRTHRERIEAAGVTRRPVTDDKHISAELARALDLFHGAMRAWRGAATDESLTRKLSHHQAWVLDDRAMVEALLHAGWTSPGGFVTNFVTGGEMWRGERGAGTGSCRR